MGVRNEPWLKGASKQFAVVMLLLVATVGLGAAMLAPRVPRGAPASMSALPSVKIDLNSATAAELEALPRIGPSLARRIVEDREKHGPFRSVEELDRVKGIGPRTMELLRPFAKVTEGEE